jgi:hypothetical protein
MGAMAGGAAGAWGGHQMGHGVIGGIGGAIAGSMLEDKYKDSKKKKEKIGNKDERRAHRQERRYRRQQRGRRGSDSSSSSSSSSSSDSDHGRKHHGKLPPPMGNFRASSRDVRLEGHVLVAECADVGGHHHRASLNLNDCFTNSRGRLKWQRGGNFAPSSRHLRLVDDGNALECECGDGEGGWTHNRKDLNRRISNDDGTLIML